MAPKLAEAIKAAGADKNAQQVALDALSRNQPLDVYEGRKGELEGNIDEDKRLESLKGDIGESEIPRRMAEIDDMELRASTHELGTKLNRFSKAMTKLVDVRLHGKPNEIKSVEAEFAKSIIEARAAVDLVDKAKDTAVAGWTTARKKAVDSNEQKQCDAGWMRAQATQKYLQESLEEIRKSLATGAKLLVSHADPSAKHAAAQYHKEAEAALEKAYKFLAELRQEASKQAAQNRERDKDAKAIAAARAQESSAQRGSERAQAHHKAELHAVQARANEREDWQDWQDRLAETER